MIFFVFSEESCHMAQSGLEWKTSVIGCTAAVFLMLYQENDGMIRGFAIGGVIFGMILYFFLLSRFVVKINVCILKKILGIAGRITGFVTKPFRKIGRKIISFLCKQLKKWIKMIKMSLCKL